MSCKRSNLMNAQQRKNMTELLELISTGNNEELTHEANMFKLRNTFARDETRNISTTGGSPRRSKKYSVDDSGMQRNARLANGVHPDNTNMPDNISHSCDNLFDSETQFGKSYGDFWDRGPYGR